jgi:hypothetical protein
VGLEVVLLLGRLQRVAELLQALGGQQRLLGDREIRIDDEMRLDDFGDLFLPYPA